MDNRTLTVTQLSTYIKQIFDAEELLFNIKVTGEISGLSVVRGVAYFTLKDENASLPCVCFSLSSFDYKNGDNVVVTGTPRYYVKGGKLNFNVSKIEKNGIGELFAQFLALRQKLEDKGYFLQEIKKQLPKNIKRIGVVTSKEGAVIQDIINVRNRRNPYIDIVLYPVKVQGVNAEREIAKGIKFFENYDVDVIVVARGGGSLEDLQPFNTEIIADAIYNCKKFVMSAVGHETDFTICDFVSDMRAPTPSVASELCCVDIENQKQQYIKSIKRLRNSICDIFAEKNEQLKTNIDDIIQSFERHNSSKIRDIVEIMSKIKNIISMTVLSYDHKLKLFETNIEKLNPSEILKLGYSVVQAKGKVITNSKDVCIGDDIQIKLYDGQLVANIKEIKGE